MFEVLAVGSTQSLCPLAADSPGQLDILGHDGHTLSMNGAKVSIFKQTNKVSLRSFLYQTTDNTRKKRQKFKIIYIQLQDIILKQTKAVSLV